MGDPFRDAAMQYLAAGWHPVPLPYKQKHPPPVGTTGRTRSAVTLQQVEGWLRRPGPSNIGLVVPQGVLGIDVDAYGIKKGMATMARAKDECGALPPSYLSTGRGSLKSGIMFYRVPDDYEARGTLGPDVEVVQWFHRYAVAWPSVHPTGGIYEWYHVANGVVPVPPPAVDELPDLPDVWLDFLESSAVVEQLQPRRLAGEAQRLYQEAMGSQWSASVKRTLAEANEALLGSDSGSRHDAAATQVMRMAQLAADGQPGAEEALEAFGAVFVALVTSDGSRTEHEAAEEWRRLVDGAYHKVEPLQVGLSRVLERKDALPQPSPSLGAPERVLERLRASLGLVDWRELFNVPEEDDFWLLEPVLGRRKQHAIFSMAKVGKSLVTLGLVLRLALDRHLPVVVLDYEMTLDDLRERLEDFGLSQAELEHGHLHYCNLPSLGALDDQANAEEMEELLLQLPGVERNHDCLIMIDTMARAVAGDEDKNDTYRNFSKTFGYLAKRNGWTTVQLDHSGKDVGQGMRGASDKAGYVDVVWRLERPAEDLYTLVCTHKRSSRYPDKIILKRTDDPLSFAVDSDTYLHDLGRLKGAGLECMRELDRTTCPVDASVRDAVAWLKERGLAFGSKTVAVAQNVRKAGGEHGLVRRVRIREDGPS